MTTFPQIFMEMAESISKKSYDPKIKVGCIITSLDHIQVFSIGYNGNAHGFPNERDSEEQGSSGFIHAETNAALKCKASHFEKKNVYTTHLPCTMCFKSLVQLGGVETIYYKHNYINSDINKLLQYTNIKLIQLVGSNNVSNNQENQESKS